MPDPVQNQPAYRRSRSGAPMPIGPGVALLPVLACFLGGGTSKWAEGIIVALLGLFLLFHPPRHSLGWATDLVLFLFVAAAATAFLPAHWFYFPLWRTILSDDFGLVLPAHVSAQPWISATCLVSLIAGVCWLYFVSTRDSELRAIRNKLRLFVAGVVVLAGLSIIFYLAHTTLPFWINQRNFGPFPNRNQTGDLFGIAALVLLACGQDDLRHGRKRWILWLLGLAILTTALILNLSRAGLAILVGGSVLWILVVVLRQRSSARIAVGLSFVLLLLSAVLVLGGQTLERFHLHGLGSGSGDVTSDFRWKIFHDAFNLIGASPWCGIGLGNFDSVFALFRHESITQTRALHPESDWIWMWVEMGWPAVLLVVVGGVLIIRRVFPLVEGTNQRFRLAALLGAVIFAVHGLVDVSAHRVGTAYAGLFLLGMALHRPLPLKRHVLVPIVFRILGLALLASGLTWTIAMKKDSLLPGSVGVSSVKQLAPVARRGLNFSEAVSLDTTALAWAPLDWQLYFSRGLSEIAQKQPAKALDDFRVARYLEPNAYSVPLAEGSAWLATQPILAASAWREALRRTSTGPQRLEVYGDMFSKTAVDHPEVGRILQEVGLTQHDLVLAYLSRVKEGERFDQELQRFLKVDPDLHTMTEPEKLALFSLWADKGNLDELARQVEQHRDWMTYAWLGVAKRAANMKDYRAAYDLTEKYGDAVAMPRLPGGVPIEELQNRYYHNPDNYATGYALYREQMEHGRTDDALLTARHFTERPGVPAYFHYLEAQARAKKQDWEGAWKAWLAYQAAAARK